MLLQQKWVQRGTEFHYIVVPATWRRKSALLILLCTQQELQYSWLVSSLCSSQLHVQPIHSPRSIQIHAKYLLSILIVNSDLGYGLTRISSTNHSLFFFFFFFFFEMKCWYFFKRKKRRSEWSAGLIQVRSHRKSWAPNGIYCSVIDLTLSTTSQDYYLDPSGLTFLRRPNSYSKTYSKSKLNIMEWQNLCRASEAVGSSGKNGRAAGKLKSRQLIS